jgi:hypothetical protein
MCRIIFHLGMGDFYASAERRDDPKLRGKPGDRGFSKPTHPVIL